MLHHRLQDVPASGSLPRQPSRTISNAGVQTAWATIFRAPFRFLEERNHEDAIANPNTAVRELPVAVPTSDMPLVGGDFAFIEPQQWPATVIQIDHSMFSTTRPYPVPKTPRYIDDPCLCYGCCVAQSHLTSACVNVATCTICDDHNCSIGPGCGNRFDQRFPLDLVMTRVGLGVVCCCRIPRGAFVIEYVGEILYEEDAAEHEDQRYQAQLRTKAGWNGGMTVLVGALVCGNKSRFINHSCQPNCALYECDWANTTRLGIFATQDIPPLRELTFKYTERKRRTFECQCIGYQN